MVFGALCNALLSYFCGSSEEQRGRPDNLSLHVPAAAYKPYQRITDQPPQQYRLPPEQYQPAYKPYQRVTEQPPSRPAQYPPKPARHSPPVNAAEKNHDNEHHQDLRTRAKNEGAEMARCFEESHAARARKDAALAKQLSNEGKAYQREMERLDAQASELIFNENNKDREPGEVDLHGLYVKEAIIFTERAISNARRCGINKIRLIVGKGLHSSDGAAKLKPAIEEYLLELGLIAELDQNNSGVLIVTLSATRAVKL